ncbi:MAG: aminotransferase class I/II-fold pyridoxal phosphate-dependent enzyme [Nitrososphaerota archaeon]|uniref:aminotransferase class I/II-fold pyridoxal phosphate-dependent enzyme n=1 Tax=Candidatus Bathycorpusculum sp. TaxID=2994959 RepID=UPI00281E459A|nr:aminotransferase class I/II-fold pyridoxal phosphate-dependent enzyme [Candidatus Termitimicrobium sp.]MCL2431093.1 aminotransferase class I/II-fold pyridoxal phosphate-dependent enzyme [Candidatus Termitimicrobium sp.]MDR0492025.1 aminotransferase class I/II-fold pyridoxal phosphate-dependent enzyme [Nitrososphaerota archaeon]
MTFEYAKRIKQLPPYLFAEIEKIQKAKKAQGIDLISLSIGDPDLPPPQFIIDALAREAANQKNHNYSFSHGEPAFRTAVTNWYKTRFGIDLQPDQVIALLGSKEGIANIARAFINPGDRVLCPDPAYPVYANGSTILCDGTAVFLPLLEENNYRPDFETIDADRVKMMFINYPNNPTAATIDHKTLKEAVEFAKENNIILCYDNAYSEITYDGYRAPSILEIEGALDVAVEFHSLSKTFNMTGDRIGFAVGNKELITGLVKVKSQIDSGPPVYTQKAAVEALGSYTSRDPPEFLHRTNQILQERRDLLVDTLSKLGFSCERPKATFYVWVNCRGDSMEFATKMLEAGVAVTPGVGFGKHGEGYARITFTQPKECIKEACDRMANIF